MKTLAASIVILAAVAACSFGCTVTAGTSDTDPGGSEGAAACSACVGPLAESGGACSASFSACGDDQGCSDWITCTDDCLESGAGQSCYDACGQSSAGASALWGAVQSCVCGHCAAACNPPTAGYCSAM
jgi:hypothetical protein